MAYLLATVLVLSLSVAAAAAALAHIEHNLRGLQIQRTADF